MTTLPMNGVWHFLVTGIGSGIKQNPFTVPMTRNSWLGCLCFLRSPVYLVLTLSSGFCAQEPVKTFQKGPPPEKGN